MKTTMLNSKFQPPSIREIPINKQQADNFATAPIRRPAPRSLRLGNSLWIGAWYLALLLTTNLFAQSYSIDWFTIDGGGGTSSGGVFSVSGTIGQPDADHMSGGNYSIYGGFWGIIAAVQTPGAPLLTITLTTTNTVAVSWPSPSAGFVLQQNTNGVSSVNWSNAPGPILDDGTTKTLIVNPSTGNRFYRLKK